MREGEESEKEYIFVGEKKGARNCQRVPPETACVAPFQQKARGPKRHPVSPRLRTSPCCAQQHICDGLQGTFPAARA